MWSKNFYKESIKKNKNITYIIAYTLLFGGLFIGVYYIFVKNQLSFIQVPDGYHQYYPKIIYITDYFRLICRNFMKGDFVIPQFGWNIGLGEDIWTIMSSWIMDLPFSLFYLFVDSAHYEKIYALNIILKMYLTGCTFSYVCIKWGKKRKNVLIGALVYVFSGYLMRIGPMHPQFILPFMILPLVIYGVDKVVQRKSGSLFILSFAYLMMHGYYMTYIITLIAFVYGIVRYFEVYGKLRWKEFKGVLGNAAGGYILAFAMGMTTMLPAIVSFFESNRSGGSSFSGIFYSLDFYKRMLIGLIIPPGEYDYPALAIIAIPFLVLPFIKGKREKRSKRIFILLSGMTFALPFLGRVMNGMSYPSNRWSFGFIFLAAVCVTDGLEHLYQLKWKAWVGIVLVPLLVNIVLNGQLTFTKMRGNIAIEYLERQTVDSKILETTHGFDFSQYDNGYYRVNSTNVTNANYSMKTGVSTPVVYNSVINSIFPEYLKDIHATHATSDFRIENIDQRIQTESLLGVKYYIATEDTKQKLPYGLELEKQIGEGYYLYKNPYAFPMLYTYDAYILKEDYDKLNVLDKQKVVMDTAVVDEDQDLLYRGGQDTSKDCVEYQISDSWGIVWKDNYMEVSEAGGYVDLQFQQTETEELYVELKGINIDDSGNQCLNVTTSYGNINKVISLSSKNFTWHYDNEEPWVNLGRTNPESQTVRISFDLPGTYKIDAINLYLNKFESMGLERKENEDVEEISNVEIGVNELRCNLSFQEKKILNFNLPYSKGWKLYVDDKERGLIKINNLTMGCVVESGEHDVKILYETPCLKVSAVIQGIGWLVFLGYFIRNIKRRNYEKS